MFAKLICILTEKSVFLNMHSRKDLLPTFLRLLLALKISVEKVNI